ncbi:MAG: flagellar M-ring protein FliF [Deltaproteobacteria bacterium]|nr:flagellar M-ring protein FliF [Deltaproteobacteria bacterium]
MEQLKNLIALVFGRIRAFRISNPQFFNLIAAALGLGLAICALFYLLNPGAPIVLASNLSPADRAALALRLRHDRIDFTLGTDSISVPAGQIAQARRILDASPDYSGGIEDFSLFDRSTMGQSDFDEQVNYQRSLQGELERTLMDVHGVDNARVMLAMGNPSAFGLAPAEAERASVMLTISPGAMIDGTMARAIAHLVAGAVRGLSADNVTITGNDGAILYPPQREGELSEAMRLRNDFERRLQGKVASLLTRIMGENRYAVEVAVDVDTSQVSSEDNLYGKGDQAVLSEEHSLTPAGATVGGIPGLTSNLPAPPPSPAAAPTPKAAPTAAPPMPGFSRAEMSSQSVVNYKPSSRQIKTVTAPVRIKQITVAAVLDGTYEEGRFMPLPEQRLNAIKGLLAAAVGAQLARGDSVEVQSAALSQPYGPPVLNPITQLRTWLNSPVHILIAVGTGLAALILIIWLAKRTLSMIMGSRARMRTEKVETVAQVESMPAETTPPALPPPSPEAADANFETIRSQLNQQVGRDPVAAAEILCKWLMHPNGTTNQVQNRSAQDLSGPDGSYNG